MKALTFLMLASVLVLFSCNKENMSVENSTLVTISTLSDFETRTKTGVSLVFFHATWCSLCAAQRPHIQALLNDGELDNVFFGQVDFEKNADIVKKYDVFGFPTILIMKDGVVKHKLTGSNNKTDKLKDLLKSL